MKVKSLSVVSLVLMSLLLCSYALASDCASSPFLKRYLRSGMANMTPGGVIELRFTADLHSADCGAPDCYGTRIRIYMEPTAAGSCKYSNAVVETEDFDHCGIEMEGRKSGKVTETFFSSKGTFDPGDPQLTEVRFFSKSKTRAILISRQDLFYYENVKPGGKLNTRLPGDEDNEEECCWGASTSQCSFCKK